MGLGYLHLLGIVYLYHLLQLLLELLVVVSCLNEHLLQLVLLLRAILLVIVF